MVAQEELCLGLQGGRRQETGTPLTGTGPKVLLTMCWPQSRFTGRSKSFVGSYYTIGSPSARKRTSKKVKSRLSRTDIKGFSSLNICWRDCRSNFKRPGLTFITMPLPK
ncbi:hypothetical protein V6Z11_1Z117600 [Gossypium hirsutum]